MESCHSVSVPAIELKALSSCYPVNSSLGHLIKVLEQLRVKDGIISHLEKELGLHPGYALQLHLDKDKIQEHFSLAKMAGTTKQLSSQSSSSGSSTCHNDGTKNNSLLSKSMELEANLNKMEEKNLSLSKENGDLTKKIKEIEQRMRPLHEKNCKFLEKNMELVSCSRNLQDKLTALTEEHKKLREQADHSRKRACLLSRQLSQEKMEQGTLEIKLEDLKKQFSEQTEVTNTLKQACSEKDRRIEVIQHRKKRKKLHKCHDKNIGVKETFFGIDEDKQSVDSENSTFSSLSYGTTSDDEICDELSRGEVEKNYQHLMREHLELQKSYTLLQSLSDSCLDPQRENKVKTQLETDLFLAACRIEELENHLQQASGQIDRDHHQVFAQKEALLQKVKFLESKEEILQEELRETRESVENLEFQVLELEECQEKEHVDKCDVAIGTDNKDEDKLEECSKTEKLNGIVSELHKSEAILNLRLEMAGKIEDNYKREVENLRQQLSSLLEGRGHESEILIEKIQQLKQTEQKCMTLENIAADLQEKVISLQQEKAMLEEKRQSCLSRQPPGLTDEEQKEILALKKKLQISEKSEIKLMEKFAKLQIDLETAETKNKVLRKKLLTLEEKVDSSGTERNSDEFVDHSTQTNIIEIFKASVAEKDDRTSTSSTLLMNSEEGNSEVSNDDNDPFGHLQSELSDLQEENYLLKSEIFEKSFNEDEREERFSIENKMEELNNTCDNLQEKVNSAEISERQLREKLKLAERTINDLESSEGLVREKCDELTSREIGLRRQNESLHHNCKELREIILDKDAFEQKLQEKVNCLEEAETLSSRKISELKASNQMLQHRIDLKEEIEADVYLLETLKQQLSLTESQNRNLQSKILELEENEQILRENWLAVAEEEADQKDCLQEKVKMLELLNHELKFKIQEDQENAIVTKTTGLSLASELSASDLSSNSSGNIEVLRETIAQLNEQLQKVEDEKNSKIEMLQEKIGKHSENELKLSETLMEMEHTENELKAKLALYENSAVTVDKIIKYEDKIHELRSSQENLLDKLDSMEYHEDNLKEKLMMSEQKYEDKILMLEKEIYKHLQMEELLNNQIKDMEDNETILKDKIESLNGDNRELQKERDELVEKGEQDVSEKFHDFEMENKELKAKLTNVEQEHQDLSNRYEAKDVKKGKSEQQSKKSKLRIKELSTENEKLNQKITDLQSSMENINDELQEWKNRASEFSRLKTKLDILEEAETKLMERVVELEDLEHTLTEELEDSKKQLTLAKQQVYKSDPLSKTSPKQFSDKCIATETGESSPLSKSESRTVTGLFERSKSLEAENHELADRLSNLLTAETQAKQLSDKVKLLEQSEEQLMERVMEVEEEEDRLKRELVKVQHHSSTDKAELTALLETKEQEIEILEEENIAIHREIDILNGEQTKTELAKQLTELKNKNGELEDKIVEYEYEVSDLMDKVEQFESMYLEENKKNESNVNDSPKTDELHSELENELLTTQEKLEEVQTEYELRLSEMEDCSKEFKEELNSQVRQNEMLKQKIQELEKSKAELIDELELFQDSESDLLSKQHELLSRTVDLESKISFLESSVHKEEKGDVDEIVSADTLHGNVDEMYKSDKSNQGASEQDIKIGGIKCDAEKNSMKSNVDDSVLQKDEYMCREKWEAEKNSLEERIAELNSCASVSESKLVKFEADSEILDALRMKEKEYVFKLHELQIQHDANIKDLDTMKHCNNQYESEIRVLKQKLEILIDVQAENKENSRKIANAESVRSELLRNIEKLSEQDIENKSKLTDLENTISVLKNNSDQLSTEKMQYESKLIDMEHKLQAFRSKCDSALSQSSQTDDCEMDINMGDYWAKSKSELIELINSLEQENEKEKMQVLELSKKLEAFQNAVNEVTTMIIEEETVETEKKIETFHKLTRIQGIPEAFQKKFADLVRSNSEIRSRLSQLHQKESSLRTSFKKLEETHRRDCKDFQKEIDRLTQEKNSGISNYMPQTNSTSGYKTDLETSKKKGICDGKVLHSPQLISTVQLQNKEQSLCCSRDDQGAFLTSPVTGEQWSEVENSQQNQAVLQQQIRELADQDSVELQKEVNNLQQSENYLKAKVQQLEELLHKSRHKSDAIMLEKPEGLLKQRIMELEKIEGHLKQQVCDLEQDREELHKIARKDKDIIHDQNVHIRELQLCEKNLKEQLNHFEVSERTLFEKVADLERQLSKLEDRVKTLQIHEVRLRELVEKYKLDEEIWLTKSDDLQSSMHELSTTENALKRKINDVENENCDMSEKMEYMKLRLKEMEDAETSLNQRVEKHESMEISLQNQVAELENYESNLQTQVSELHTVNAELLHRLNHAMEENGALAHQIAQLQHQQQALDRELVVLHDSEISLRQQVQSLERSKSDLKNQLESNKFGGGELQSRLGQKEQADLATKEKISTLQRNENRLKSRILELENSGVQVLSELSNSQREKLPKNLEECQKRIVHLQNQNSNFQERLLRHREALSSGNVVQISRKDYLQLQAKVSTVGEVVQQMKELENINESLKFTIAQLREGKDVCGHEAEMDTLKQRLVRAHISLQRLQKSLSDGQCGPKGQQGETELLPEETVMTHESDCLYLGLTEGKEAKSMSAAPGGLRNRQRELFSTIEEEPLYKVSSNRAYTGPSHMSGKESPSMYNYINHFDTSDVDVQLEEVQWKAIESHQPKTKGHNDEHWVKVAEATSFPSGFKYPGSRKEEELVIGVTLPSENESAFNSQNDTDSNIPSLKDKPGKLLKNFDGSLDSQPPPLPDTSPPPLEVLKATDNFVESFFVSNVQEVPPEGVLTNSRDARTTSHKPVSWPLGSMDSVPDSGRDTSSLPSITRRASTTVTVLDRIAQIEHHLQHRPYMRKDSEEEDGVFAWRSKALENGQHLETAQSEIRSLREEINKLEKQLEEKNRYILILEVFIDDIEKLIQEQDSDKEHLVKGMEKSIGQLRFGVKEAGLKSSELNRDPAALHTELHKKERELATKRIEVDSLMQELRQWQEECCTIESMRSHALDSLHCLEMEIDEHQNAEKEVKYITGEYNKVQQTNKELEERCNVLSSVVTERDRLQQELDSLKVKVTTFGKIENENMSLEEKLNATTQLLEERTRQIDNLSKDVSRSKTVIKNLEEQYLELRKANVGYENMKARYEEMEEAKNKALMSVAPLKAKVNRLTQKCKDKDDILRRLSTEVRNMKLTAKPLSLLEELGQLEACLADDEANRSPSSPSSLGTLEEIRSVSDATTSKRNESTSQNRSLSGSSFSDSEQQSHASDSELIRDSVILPQQRPRSADLFDRRHRQPVSSSQNRSLDRLPQLNGTSAKGPRKHSGDLPCHLPDNPIYIAVADYHPELFSQSGRPNLELSLQEEDQVLITGPLDARGYYEAVVNGKTGLVPASHIQPASHIGPKFRRQKKLQSVPLYLDPSPEKILQMHNQLKLSHTPRRQLPQKPVGKSVKLPKVLSPDKSTKGQKNYKSAEKLADNINVPEILVNGHSDVHSQQSSPRSKQAPKKRVDVRRSILQGPPTSPTEFHVDKVMSENSIMVSWNPPCLDGHNYNSGCQVTGYKIFMNGQQCHEASSPHSKKAVIKNVDLTRPQRLGIQTVSLSNTASNITEFIFEGVEILSNSPNNTVSDVDFDPVPAGSIYETGEKRIFMGVYDYSPMQQSPHNYTNCELNLQTGDVITVYGPERPDGFYHGEINGQRGLVPASFMEEMPSKTSGFKQTGSHRQAKSENRYDRKEERRKSAGKKS